MRNKCKNCCWLRVDIDGAKEVHEKAEFFYVLCYPCQLYKQLTYRAPDESSCKNFDWVVK